MLFIIQKIDYPYVKQCSIEDFCPVNDAHASSMAYVFSCCLNNYIIYGVFVINCVGVNGRFC